MPRYYFYAVLFFLLPFTGCKKEVSTPTCQNSLQKAELLSSLSHFQEDTSGISAEERRFFNDIRRIANDLGTLTAGIDTRQPIAANYEQVRAAFLQHAAEVEQAARIFYGDSPAKTILAKNAFVLMSYDALERQYPEFLWTKLGIFAANEVRSGLVVALKARHILQKNNIHIPFGNSGGELTDALLESSEILIQGQINVLTDIGSLGILNRLRGADQMKAETWLTTEAREGFRLQEKAENALRSGDCDHYMDLQTAAAIQFGAHEQIYILQPMWDQPMMQLFAAMDEMVIRLTGHDMVVFGNIFLGTNKSKEAGKGHTIPIPAGVTDLSNAQQRVQVAMNGFHTLNDMRKDPKWSYWIDYSQIKIGYFGDTYRAPDLE